jgi:eukaryotic-like serine/threonine-protein kinase
MANLMKRNSNGTPGDKKPVQQRIIAERYLLGPKIGRGSNALVYQAKDLKSSLPVTVKLFFEDLENDPQFVARFRKEIRATSKLQHPNIMAILDYGYDEGNYYQVTDYFESRNLQKVIKEHTTLELNQIVALTSQI